MKKVNAKNTISITSQTTKNHNQTMKKTAKKTIIVTTNRFTNVISEKAIKEQIALVPKCKMDNKHFEQKSSIMMILEVNLQLMAA